MLIVAYAPRIVIKILIRKRLHMHQVLYLDPSPDLVKGRQADTFGYVDEVAKVSIDFYIACRIDYFKY